MMTVAEVLVPTKPFGGLQTVFFTELSLKRPFVVWDENYLLKPTLEAGISLNAAHHWP